MDPIGKTGEGIVVVIWVVVVIVVMVVVIWVVEVVVMMMMMMMVEKIPAAKPFQFILSIPLFSGLGSVQTDKSYEAGNHVSNKNVVAVCLS